MYVCICRRVTDKTIRQCVQQGAECAEQVGRMCRAGTDCGNCLDQVDDLVADEKKRLPMLDRIAS
jgi:bacterioferritin-associated ferredoxin